jgi:hypothetical protein
VAGDDVLARAGAQPRTELGVQRIEAADDLGGAGAVVGGVRGVDPRMKMVVKTTI